MVLPNKYLSNTFLRTLNCAGSNCLMTALFSNCSQLQLVKYKIVLIAVVESQKSRDQTSLVLQLGNWQALMSHGVLWSHDCHLRTSQLVPNKQCQWGSQH